MMRDYRHGPLLSKVKISKEGDNQQNRTVVREILVYYLFEKSPEISRDSQ